METGGAAAEESVAFMTIMATNQAGQEADEAGPAWAGDGGQAGAGAPAPAEAAAVYHNPGIM